MLLLGEPRQTGSVVGADAGHPVGSASGVGADGRPAVRFVPSLWASLLAWCHADLAVCSPWRTPHRGRRTPTLEPSPRRAGYSAGSRSAAPLPAPCVDLPLWGAPMPTLDPSPREPLAAARGGERVDAGARRIAEAGAKATIGACPGSAPRGPGFARADASRSQGPAVQDGPSGARSAWMGLVAMSRRLARSGRGPAPGERTSRRVVRSNGFASARHGAATTRVGAGGW